MSSGADLRAEFKRFVQSLERKKRRPKVHAKSAPPIRIVHQYERDEDESTSESDTSEEETELVCPSGYYMVDSHCRRKRKAKPKPKPRRRRRSPSPPPRPTPKPRTKRQFTSLKRQLSKCRQRLERREDQLVEFAERLFHLQRRRHQLQQRHHEGLRHGMNSEKLRSILNELVQHETELAKHESQLSTIKQDIRQLRSQRHAIDIQLTQPTLECKNEIDGLHTKLGQCETNLAARETRIRQLEDDLKGHHVSYAKSQSELEQVRQLLRELESKRAEQAVLARSEDLVRLREQVEQLLDEKRELKEQYDSLARFESPETQLVRAQEKIAECRDELRVARRTVEQKKEALLKSEANEKQLEEKLKEIGKWQQKAKSLEEERETLKGEIRSAKQKLVEFEKTKDALRHELEELKHEADAMKEKYQAQLQGKYDELLTQCEKQKESLKNDLYAAQTVIQSLKEQLNHEQTRKGTEEGRLGQLEAEIQTLRQRAEDAERKNHQSREEVARTEEQLQTCRLELAKQTEDAAFERSKPQVPASTRTWPSPEPLSYVPETPQSQQVSPVTVVTPSAPAQGKPATAEQVGALRTMFNRTFKVFKRVLKGGTPKPKPKSRSKPKTPKPRSKPPTPKPRSKPPTPKPRSKPSTPKPRSKRVASPEIETIPASTESMKSRRRLRKTIQERVDEEGDQPDVRTVSARRSVPRRASASAIQVPPKVRKSASPTTKQAENVAKGLVEMREKIARYDNDPHAADQGIKGHPFTTYRGFNGKAKVWKAFEELAKEGFSSYSRSSMKTWINDINPIWDNR